MNTSAVVVQGTLRADGTLELDEKPSLPPGRVRVRVEPTPPESLGESLWEVLERIWASRQARGENPRPAEEIDAEINALRDEYEERLTEIRALQPRGRSTQERT